MPLRLRSMFERIPLPSLRYYTFISTSLLFANVLYFHHLIQLNKVDSSIVNNSTNKNVSIFYSNANTFSFGYIETLLSILLTQSYSFLILINAIYCSIILFVKQYQVYIFGELRVIESQRLKDKFWNYAFYKFCFLFGVLGLENLNELILWVSWFFILSFAILSCQLAKDRFELLSISPSIPRQSLIKIIYFLISILCLCISLFTICFLIGLKYGGLSIFFFMFAETILLTLDTSYILKKYIFIQQENTRTYFNYYLEFLFDISTLTIDILYHIQMLFYHQTFMSMSSLIFFMQLKPLFNELTQRLKRHKSYRSSMIRMEKKYPLLTKYDLEEKSRQQKFEEICSICWEKFEKAQCLPCGHLFHQNCLRSWLEQDTTCPICRLSLQEDNTQPVSSTQNLIANNGQRRGRNHLFTFNGNRYSSWLPSFSIEINHNFPFRLGRARLTDIQLTSMAQSVQQIFPQIPFEVIRSDLQITQSIDTTIENFIERQIQFEPQQQEISGSEDSLSDIEEPIHTELLSDSSRIIQNDDDNFTWPLDPNLSFAQRKQQLISHMRRQYLQHEHHLRSSSHKSDLLTHQ